MTTHIFDPDNPCIHSDAVLGVKESMLADFRPVDDPARTKELEFKSRFWEDQLVLAAAAAFEAARPWTDNRPPHFA